MEAARPGREEDLRDPPEMRLVLGVALILKASQLLTLWPLLGQGTFRQESAGQGGKGETEL